MDRQTPSVNQQIALKKQATHQIPITPQNVVANQQQRVDCALGKNAVNTHFFDGRLPSFTSSIDKHIAQSINNDILRASQMSKEDKTKGFRLLEEKVRTYSLQKNGKIPANSAKYLRLIVSTHDRFGRVASGNGNYDSKNRLYACDLLYLLYEKIMSEEDSEYLNLTLEQLSDMATGQCSQGRTTRLFQALIMLRTDLTSTSNYID